MIDEIRMAFPDNRLLILTGAMLLTGLIFAKGKRKLFFVPAIVISAIALNPVFYDLWYRFNDRAYWRTLWLLPVITACSLIPALFVDIVKKDVWKTAVIMAGAMIVILCGNLVYGATTFVETANVDKLPDDVVKVAEALLELDDEPYVVADASLSTYLRQYSGKIKMPYARSISYGSPSELGRELNSRLNSGDYSEVARLLINNDYEYLATYNAEGKQAIGDAGFELISQIGNYGVYRVHAIPTEVRTYNDRHQVTSITTVDENSVPVNSNSGFAKVIYEYDDYGWITYEFHEDADGNGVADKYGQAGYRREYDQYGSIIQETLLGVDGQPVIIGFATRQCEYNHKHKLTRESYFDENGDAMLHTSTEIASRELRYDGINDPVEERYYGLDGKLKVSSYGYASYVRDFDKDGYIVSEKYRDTEGNLSLCSEGYAEIRREVDAGKLKSKFFYDVDGKRINSIYGYSGFRVVYNSDRTESLQYYEDAKGNPLEMGTGYFHDWLRRLDPETEIILVASRDDASSALTSILVEDMHRLGIQTDLRGKYRYSFYAVIHETNVEEQAALEKLSSEGEIDGVSYSVISAGTTTGDFSSIKLDNEEYSKNARGLNFVVYDLEKHEVADVVAFDTYSSLMTATR